MSIGRRAVLISLSVAAVLLCGWCSLLSGVSGWVLGSEIATREAGMHFQATTTAGVDLPPLGVLVTRIERGSPAAQAGVIRGDVIVAADGTAVEDARDLRDALLRHKPGDVVRLTIDRGDGPRDVEVTLGDFPGSPQRGYLGIYFTARAEDPADL
jgi:S1-C subfamily serine protease